MATTVIFDDATAVYADCGVGMATYSVEGSSSITAQRLILSQGANGRTAVMTVKDTASVNVTGTSDVDSNQSSIMFGHWNGPSTFTIQDNATFTAASQVLVGKTANNHTININGGTFTAKGIKVSASASGTNAINLNGGLLVLGDVGITSYSTSRQIPVCVNSDSEVRASASELPISQGITIASAVSLSLTKSASVPSTVVTLSGTPNGEGRVSVAEGVTLKLGTIRPSWTFAVDGTLAVTLSNKADVIALNASKEPASVVLYDVDGTEISNAKVSYDNGTLRVSNSLVWENTLGDGKFDSEGNWYSNERPGSSGTDKVVVNVVGETPITVSSDYVVDEFSVVGGGSASFSGTGAVAANTAYVYGGSTLDTNGRVTFQNLSLESSATGIVTSADGLANGGLTGAGTFVIDPGAGVTKTMSAGNTSFTGEAVIASGTVKMGDASSFGPIPSVNVIRVKGSATLDENGMLSGYYSQNKDKNCVILEKGAIFTQSVAPSDEKQAPVTSIALEGDALIDASNARVTVAHQYNYSYTKVDLGTNTLEKIGEHDFFLSATTISGTGMLHVKNGSLTISPSYYDNALNSSCTDGTLVFDTGTTFSMQSYQNRSIYFTAKNLVLDGEVIRGSKNSTLTVTGYITGSGTTPMLTLAEGAVIKPAAKGCLKITESLITASEDGTVTIDISDVDFASRTSVPLFRVGSAEMLPEPSKIIINGELPEGWELAKMPTGFGYRLRKPIGFAIRLR